MSSGCKTKHLLSYYLDRPPIFYDFIVYNHKGDKPKLAVRLRKGKVPFKNGHGCETGRHI